MMGFFDKRSAQEKEFDKALKAALAKPNEKTFGSLEAACRNYAPGWQGWLLMGLCYDCGAGVTRDAAKAAEYHAQAKQCGDNWALGFYAYYERSAGNIYMEDLTERALACRRMGTAAMYFVDTSEQHLSKGVSDSDIEFFRSIYSKVDTGGLLRSSDEQLQVSVHESPFTSWLAATAAFKNGKGNAQDVQMFSKEFFKQVKAVQKRNSDTISSAYADSWLYVAGAALLFAGSYGGFVYDFSDDDQRNRIRKGFHMMWQAADRGNVAAMYLLADMADDKDYLSLIIDSSTHSDNLITLASLLSIAEEKGHAGAKAKLEELMKLMAKL
ncbi:MAG: hypothetical protein MRZ97_07255 [Firmicutes bacterium]|nr:hypothetical protein [Bacillota bacterium]